MMTELQLTIDSFQHFGLILLVHMSSQLLHMPDFSQVFLKKTIVQL